MGKNQLFSDRIMNVIKLVFLAVFTALMLFYALTSVGNTPIYSANAERGEAVLGGVGGQDYETSLFLLDGEWEYYPNRLLFPEDFRGGTHEVRYAHFPHYWRNDTVNFPDGRGYATYRLIVMTPESSVGAGIFSVFQYGAYRIFLDGELIVTGGNISENRDEYFFSYNGGSGYVRPSPEGYGNRNEIIVQVQNYDHVAGGLSGDIFMGSPLTAGTYHSFIMVLNGITIGTVIVLLFYFLLLFIRNKDKKEYLDFTIVSLCCIYIAMTYCGENIAYNLSSVINPGILYKLEFIAFLVGAYFASMHITKRYSGLRYAPHVGTIYTAVFCALVIILTPYQISVIRFVFHGAALVHLLFALVFSFNKAFIRRDANADRLRTILEFSSLVILIGGTTISRLGVTPWKGFDLYPAFAVIYCFIQIFVLAGYYREVERNLVKMTKTLENRVAERTAALVEMNSRVQAANDVKGEFLTRMSHEIRTPMNAIVGMSELFNTDNLNETQKNYFMDIKETSHTLLQLINDIMDFSKIEEGKMTIIPAHFNLQAFLEGITSTAKFSAKIKGLTFEIVTADNLPKVIYADEMRMKQIIMNIISNAVKYTAEGTVKLEVASTAKPGSAESMLLFTVSDTGAGIREENIPRIFDAFMQPDSDKDKGIAGTGLGLAICKRLMDMQHGRIEVESELGKGSVFRFYFPLEIGDESLVEDLRVNEKIYAKDAKILVVEDNSINITVALGILATHDIKPDIAKDGYQALEMVQRKDYDLIFMDQFMPGIDGIETTKKIREMGGKYNSMPIIALTANAVPGARDMMLFMGMSDYVSKPIDHNALNRVLVRWLPHSKISSSLGRFSNQEKDEHLDELPRELVEIAELNCSAALKKIDGSAPIYIELMHQFTEETGNYIESLSEYLEKQDLENYRIVINGVKSLLYNIGAKACGDMASELEKAAAEKNEKFCNEKNDAFAESLKWLSQRVALALPATLSEP